MFAFFFFFNTGGKVIWGPRKYLGGFKEGASKGWAGNQNDMSYDFIEEKGSRETK